MTLARFRSQNHPQQTAIWGAREDVDDRGTLPEVFAAFSERFGGFTLDVAASPLNTKCDRFFTIHDNGLEQSWSGERVWCNPPYSDIRSWVQKAWDEMRRAPELPAELIVMLLPANRTEQGWWQDLVEPALRRRHRAFRVEFLPGRMRFIRPGVQIPKKGDRPPFGNCLLIWSGGVR